MADPETGLVNLEYKTLTKKSLPSCLDYVKLEPREDKCLSPPSPCLKCPHPLQPSMVSPPP